MKPTTKRAPKEQAVCNPPQRNWRVAVVRPSPSTMGGRFVAARYRVDPALADLVANLAGLGEVRS